MTERIYEKVKDSGNRQKFESGAVRDIQEGKGRFDLIPPIAIKRLAKHYENGSKKYGDRNWEKGIPVSRCMDSCFRHLYNYMAGDYEEDHLAAAMWNIAAIMHYEKYNTDMHDLDNIPWRPNGIKVVEHKCGVDCTCNQENDKIMFEDSDQELVDEIIKSGKL